MEMMKLLLTTGRYLYNEVTDEGKKRHYFQNMLDSFSISQNEYIVWLASRTVSSEDEWIKMLKEKKLFSNDKIMKHIKSLKDKKLVIHVDINNENIESLSNILVTRNGHPLMVSQADKGAGYISDINVGKKLPVTNEQYWVYVAATSDSLAHVLVRIKEYLKCGEIEARNHLALYIKELNEFKLWTMEYVGTPPPELNKISNQNADLITVGFPLGIIKIDENTTFGVATNVGSVLLGKDDYIAWATGNHDKITDETVKNMLFSEYDEDCLFLCPRGYVKHIDEANDKYIFKSISFTKDIEHSYMEHLLWITIHSYVPLSTIRKMILSYGMEEELVDSLLKYGAFLLIDSGLATLVKR